jgi:hypothetical protein
MSLPKTFRNVPEKVLASYNGIDLATGRGIAKFYLGDSSSGYALNSNVFFGNMGYTEDAGSPTYLLDIDFDKTLEKPLVIEGDAIVCLTPCLGQTGGGGLHTWTWNVAFSKWDGTTETILANRDFDINTPNWPSTGYRVFKKTISLTIPKTKFKIGDTIRVTVKNEGDADGSWFHLLGHDPKNRADLETPDGSPVINWALESSTGSESFVLIPILVDL